MKYLVFFAFILSLNAHAFSQSEYESYIINNTIASNCKGYAHYRLPSGHQVDCIDKDTIWHYGFAKNYKSVLDKLLHIEAITKQNSQIVFICQNKSQCDSAVNNVNRFTRNNNLESIQMSAVVIEWL